MPHYIVLGKWTEQGIRNVKDAPKRAENTRRMIEQSGGKIQLFYTIGEYDFVEIFEAPNDETMMKTLVWLGSQGAVRTTTLKAWTESEGAKVIGQLP